MSGGVLLVVWGRYGGAASLLALPHAIPGANSILHVARGPAQVFQDHGGAAQRIEIVRR